MDLLLPGLGFFVWTFLAFIVVFLILRKFAWGPILSSLHEREKHIADSIATADKVRAEMAQLKSENEALMAQAREERSKMLKEAKENGDRLINEARDKAKSEAAKILSDAAAALETQKMAALTEVKNTIGNFVVDIAEKVLRRELSDKPGQEKYIKDLSGNIKLN
jgi:F-type H+-transporting ATPase subunit b